MVYTKFWDMHSGGGQKEEWSIIYIEAPQDEAEQIFFNRFGHNPNRVTCTCCGNDYSIDESVDLAQASGHHRGCRYAYKDKDGNIIPEKEAWVLGKGTTDKVAWKGYIEEEKTESYFSEKFMSVEEYKKQKDVLVITKEEIKDDERKGDLPEQGYVWRD